SVTSASHGASGGAVPPFLPLPPTGTRAPNRGSPSRKRLTTPPALSAPPAGGEPKDNFLLNRGNTTVPPLVWDGVPPRPPPHPAPSPPGLGASCCSTTVLRDLSPAREPLPATESHQQSPLPAPLLPFPPAGGAPLEWARTARANESRPCLHPPAGPIVCARS